MESKFFDSPILNSPYTAPTQHWELDETGQPTGKQIDKRRRSTFITPIPKSKKKRGGQTEMVFDEGLGLSSDRQKYEENALINEIRDQVTVWRSLSKPHWGVTPETARLLDHWRNHPFTGIRPFFCQVEAVETAIWLTEVAPNTAKGKAILEGLKLSNLEANPELFRLALKLATGAGKTTVMAMLIAWQTVNAVRYKNSRKFTRGFLIITPGLTIKDRLRVLQPNDPDSYYKRIELVPGDLMDEIHKAKIVITNYHAFKHRERLEISKGTKALLQGQTGETISTLETDGQLVQRVAGPLQGLKNIMVINDEAHHCYREKPDSEEDGAAVDADEKDEIKKNKEAARLWISGIEIVNDQLGVNQVIDLSATPFFLRGSGYVEGTLFPWTVSDFSLMDAIECGIVKLPRVPVADNTNADVPLYRDLWENIRKQMPKKGRATGGSLDPAALPPPLLTALDALYGHYVETFEAWQQANIAVPPCFIIVCNNTATSKLVYDYISGYDRTLADGTTQHRPGRLDLFRNFDLYGNPLEKPRTLLIDSEQLESGEELSADFKKAAEAEIERFRQEIIERTGDRSKADNLTDADLLREVMNTVGKKGALGESIRCVVSVSMLTEGWDTNTVTHILGVRAFGTQLLCEQVIGRALRRLSYELNDQGQFNVEYADVLGIPFDFTAKPAIAKPTAPKPITTVKAINPDREHLEIRFPNVVAYTFEREKGAELKANWTPDSAYRLTPELVGATQTQNAGIVGEHVNLTLAELENVRPSQILMQLTGHVWETKFTDADGNGEVAIFGQVKKLCREWLDNYLVCEGDTKPAQILYRMFADDAAQRIHSAVVRNNQHDKRLLPITDAYNPTGSTRHVQFNTSKTELWETDPRKCHINYVVCDSAWEAEFCRVLESLPQVTTYVKNHNLGFEIPYQYNGENRRYRPDFIVQLGQGADARFVIVEIKGQRDEADKAKCETAQTFWIPAVNNAGTFGKWSFVELKNPYTFEKEFIENMQQVVEAQILPLNL